MENSNYYVKWYLMNCDNFLFRLDQFNVYRKEGQRYGQAFFNALPREDQNKLNGTLYDTFYSDNPFDCYLAIENVLTK